MKKCIAAILAIMWVCLAAGLSPVLARDTNRSGRFFAGLEYARQDIENQTGFIRDISGHVIETSDFDNPYTGDSTGIFLGYTLPWDRFYLSTRLFFTRVYGEFELNAGSSRFVNRLNHAFGLDLMPGITMGSGVSLFAKLGVIRGDFDFSKSSPTSTTYAVSKSLNGYTLGIGGAYEISPRYTLRIGFDQHRYEKIRIRASAGPMNDWTAVKPRSDTVYLTLEYNF